LIPPAIINEAVDWGVAAWAQKASSVGLAEMMHGIFALANQRHKEAITAGHQKAFDVWWAEFAQTQILPLEPQALLFDVRQLKLIRQLTQFAFQEGILFSENAGDKGVQENRDGQPTY
jgi:hypothetical protein